MRIIFNWNSLYNISSDYKDYVKFTKEQIKSLTIEAASEFNSTKYVDKPIDFLKGNRELFIYFNNNGRHYGAAEINEFSTDLKFDRDSLINEGFFLSTCFHEFSHEYDYRKNLLPYVNIFLKGIHKIQREKSILSYQRCRKIYEESKKYKDLKGLILNDLFKDEIIAYKRQLNYMETLRNRDWNSLPFDEVKLFCILKLEDYKQKLIK